MPRGEPLRVLHGGFLPGQVLVDAYGQGGFRFGGMSHIGSILVLPSGVHAWTPTLDEVGLARVFAEAQDIDMLLIGSGKAPVELAEPLRWRLRDAAISVDVMPTGLAATTYNIVFSEGRRVAAALMAVD